MLLSAVSVLVVAQSSSEIPEELMNNPVYNHTVKFRCSATLFTAFEAIISRVKVNLNTVKYYISAHKLTDFHAR